MHFPSLHLYNVVQRENYGWGVRKIIEGNDLVNNFTYQKILSDSRRRQSWDLKDKLGIDCQLEEVLIHFV